ncbi:beta-1,6-N-acetylglucosaminyltransferase [Falsirhodobacter halotolerans]|uniref:beta-1,6-N-acetylglucosaminyltransferase n=1 Tax=Falsirhodobacter halotolerans TaxID=1146892 RepID=UPI001FD0E443|nr:beta-1,6-N-acetylglucosaminyltransferase [Falsirhodobacter halotolerans]MCJ8138363.1 beta-1,6-N-acetylglucosaminyltransferase [Falsirhodobacter halotolerans]
MSVGFVMLCHTALDRVAQVARHWAEQGCPVVIHVDSRVRPRELRDMKKSLDDMRKLIRFSPRYRCEWGGWNLVAATQAASQMMLRQFPGVRHVYLTSGACLPLRPAADLVAYLNERPETDFIESVMTEEVGWTIGGLNIERFRLFFPFSWRRNRRVFDIATRMQQRLGVRRRIPQGIVPHLGSQWWCLTRKTLLAILDSPERVRHDRYFRRVWIPDESYFQTLVRRYSTDVESRSLTLFKFDFQGKPHIFYDDHLSLLRRSDCFVARKAWAHADRLYDHFLSPAVAEDQRSDPNPGRIDRLFSAAKERRVRGRAGLYMQSRFPVSNFENGRTAMPYSVLQGFAELMPDFPDWLTTMTETRVHGHLFGPERVEFAGGQSVFRGGLSDSAKLRDYNPKSFLTSLIWNTRPRRQCFMFGPADNQTLNGFMAADPNAQISIVSGAWAVPLYRSGLPFSDIRREAARLQRVEMEFLDLLEQHWVKARVRIWPLATFLDKPTEPLQTIIEEIAPRLRPRLTSAPNLVDLTGFGQFLQDLRNQGMQPMVMGDYPANDIFHNPDRQVRPHLVS